MTDDPHAGHALVVVDVQRGFDEPDVFGERDNPACEDNVAALIAAWRSAERPIVFVRHDWEESGAPLEPGSPGHAFKAVVSGTPDLLVTKTVHSAFLGTPDLAAWLHDRDLEGIVVCGITADHCVSTTVRMGADLGFDVILAADATHAFARTGPAGEAIAAETVSLVTIASLDDEFATVAATADLV